MEDDSIHPLMVNTGTDVGPLNNFHVDPPSVD
jgi:hypothetical protein